MNLFTKKPNRHFSTLNTSPETPLSEAEVVDEPASLKALKPMVLNEEGDIETVVSEDVTFVGNLMSKGDVTIDGTIKGDMHCASITIAQNGEILGNVVAQEVIIAGHVMGDVYAQQVILKPSGHVEGDIFHTKLAIELDASFDGRSRRSDDPLSQAPMPEGFTDERQATIGPAEHHHPY